MKGCYEALYDGRCDGGRSAVCVTAMGAELMAGVMVGVVVYV